MYRWWSTKGELVLNAAEDEISIGAVPDTGDAIKDIEIGIEQLLETFTRPLAAIVIFAAITTGADDPKMAKIFRDRFVYPWRKSAAEALQRAAASGRIANDDTQFLLDVIVGTVFQRTLVLKEPRVEGLAQSLVSLLRHSGGKERSTL